MQPSLSERDDPGLEGPDYVALVIEWGEEDEDDDDDENATTLVSDRSELAHHPGTIRTIAAVLGAIGALMLAAWGIRRLRSA
jgi:hypothetical protein